MKFEIEKPKDDHALRVYCFGGSPRSIYVALIEKLLEQGYDLYPPFYDFVKFPGLKTQVKIVCVLPCKIEIRKTGEIMAGEKCKVRKGLELFDKIIKNIINTKSNIDTSISVLAKELRND